MDEVSLTQSSFYEDEPPVKGSQLIRDRKVFNFKSTFQKLEDYASDGCDFTVLVHKEQACKTAELESKQDINNATSRSHFMSQESQTALSTGIAMTSKHQDLRDVSRNISTECGITVSPPCKRPRLLDNSHEELEKDTRKSGTVQSELYLEWNARSQFQFELTNKVPAGWPAIGAKSTPTEYKSPTLSFFTLVAQARLLPQQQLDEIKRHELNGFNGHCHRPAFKTSSPSRDLSHSRADKFHKIDLEVEEESSFEDNEFYLQEETSRDCSSDHIDTDQEVPMQEVTVNHPERLSAETNDLTWEASTQTNTFTQGGSNNGVSCAKSFCSKFAQSQENAADSEMTKPGFSISCLTINNEAEIIPDPLQRQEALRTRSEYVVPNIGYSFCLLPLETGQKTELCSSLRNIDERDLIEECLDGDDWSPLPSRNELFRIEASLFYEQEEVQDLTNCSSLINHISRLQGLEHMSTCSPSNSKQASCIECFSKVKAFESQENQPQDCSADEQTAYQVEENLSSIDDENYRALENHEQNTRLRAAAEAKHRHIQDTRKWEGTPADSQTERYTNQQTMESISDISGQEGDSHQNILRVSTDGLLKVENDDRENNIDISADNNHQRTKNVNESSVSENKGANNIHDHSGEASSMLRAQIESGMLDLDGPELLQYAMMLVQGALTKSQTVIGCGDGLRYQEKKEISRALPTFSWKNKLAYYSQNALHTSEDDKASTSGSCVSDQNSETRDGYPNEGPPLVRPLPRNSSNRPLRLGLSRKHNYQPLHPYFKKQ